MWSVESTRWPVSAAVSAISIVSRSRISPTRITFGAWRSAARSASAKVGVSAVQLALVDRGFLVQVQEFDRVFDRHDVLGARLVDQVDDRRQRRRLARARRAGHEHDAVLERRRSRRAAPAASDPRATGSSFAITRMTIANVPRWLKTLTRKRAQFGIAVREVAGALALSASRSATARCRRSAAARSAPCARA